MLPAYSLATAPGAGASGLLAWAPAPQAFLDEGVPHCLFQLQFPLLSIKSLWLILRTKGNNTYKMLLKPGSVGGCAWGVCVCVCLSSVIVMMFI